MKEQEIDISLEHLFFSHKHPVDEVGFFFGAGASKDAGYPLTWELTRDVFKKLDGESVALVSELLKENGLELDISNGSPDIEQVNDLVLKRRVETGNEKFINLETSIKNALTRELLEVIDVNLSHHITFIKALKKRSNNRKARIWIYTTNYDLLFERAATANEIALENGFTGSSVRFFDPSTFRTERGIITNKFTPMNITTLNLVKLHGSIDWYKNEDKIFQSSHLEENDKHLILPNRRKILDTLDRPYAQLFKVSNESIGSNCKYIVSCGHSFRDEHINETLFLPKLRENKICVMALFDKLPNGLDELTKFDNFNYITSEQAKISGKIFKCKTDLWQFAKLSQFLIEKLA